MLIRKNPWETTTKEGLISLPPPYTHKLYLWTSGPPRSSPNTPVPIFITGGGAPIAAYATLQTALAKKTRCYFYNRAGYHQSDLNPSLTTSAEDTARELEALMRTVNAAPPFVLIAHSYGGIILRTFIELFPEKVAGAVLIDTATEMLYEILHRFPREEFDRVIEGVDLFELNGLKEASGFTDEQWENLVEGSEMSREGTKRENAWKSAQWLAEKRQFERCVLGDKVLNVVKCDFAGDQRLVWNEGVRRGNGSEEDRKKGEELVKGVEWYNFQVMSAQLLLSRRCRFVVKDCGHDFPNRKPDEAVSEIMWVMDELKKDGGR